MLLQVIIEMAKLLSIALLCLMGIWPRIADGFDPRSTPTPHSQQRAVVVGGGPVGLASAIMLSNRGYNVSVFEATPAKELKQFNPAVAYLYNVNARGQTFTKMFPSIHKKLVERSVSSNEVGVKMAPGDITKKINTNSAMIRNMGQGTVTYWIPRHIMNLLLWEVVDEQNESLEDSNNGCQVGKIHFEQGKSCVGIYPSNENEDTSQITVVIHDVETGEEKKIEGNLIVGADGVKSKVRECLKEKQNLFGTWKYKAKNFEMKKFISPATGLKLKALQLATDKISIKDADGTKLRAAPKDFIISESKLSGPFDYLSLGCLPVQDSQKIRPANFITRPNHVLWTMKSGAAIKEYYKRNFPRWDFDEMVSNDEEWERFAKAKGLSFPPCQYSPGLQASADNGECGVVLLGDAAHSFSPDIGQGINAGLMDVVQFNETLAKASGNIGELLNEYERVQAPDTRALIRIARFGAPYQYNQPLQKDRIGKSFWIANLIMRLLFNKITFGLFPKQMILMVNDNTMTYRQIARWADAGTLGLVSIAAVIALKLLFP